MTAEELWQAIEKKPGFALLEKRELAMLRLLAEGTSLYDMRACASMEDWRKQAGVPSKAAWRLSWESLARLREAGFVRGFYGSAGRGTIHATWPADIIGGGQNEIEPRLPSP